MILQNFKFEKQPVESSNLASVVYDAARQLLDIREGEQAESKMDFIHKLAIALKEANETEYWLYILKDSGFINNKMFISIQPECLELISY